MERERETAGKRIFVVSICIASAAARARLQLPRIILKNNVFFNSEPGPFALADDRRPGVSLFFLAGRVCINL